MITSIKREIEDYIGQNNTTGALLLSGKWGAGKTHFVKEIVKEINQNGTACISIVSLFGLDTIKAVEQKVREAYASFYIGALGEKAHSLNEKFGHFVESTISVIKTATDNNTAVSSVSKGVSSVLSTNIYEFFEVKNYIHKQRERIPFILVFDDFERCNNISIDDRLGIINDYLENKEIKVIIIANEEKLKDPRYKEIKEKLIYRTLRLDGLFSLEIAETIIDSYETKSDKYKGFINDNKNYLMTAFKQSGYNNLRTLIACLNDFERIHESWQESGISTKKMPENLYKFCVYEYEAKAGHFLNVPEYGIYQLTIPVLTNAENNTIDENKKNDALDILESKYMENTFSSPLHTLQKWAIDNIWNEEDFLEELRDRYQDEIIDPERRFIQSLFWDLEQEDIYHGLPALLERAYKGEASCDELITLLQKIHYLNIYKINLPCEIDYNKIDQGFIERLNRIKHGLITEPKRFNFAEKKEIDPEAWPIYQKINSIERILAVWENRNLFIAFLKGDSPINEYELKNRCVGSFDNELLDLFLSQYTSANNKRRRDLARTFTGIYFEGDNIDRSDDPTIENLEVLIWNLKNSISAEEKTIASAITMSFIDNLEKKVDVLKSKD